MRPTPRMAQQLIYSILVNPTCYWHIDMPTQTRQLFWQQATSNNRQEQQEHHEHMMGDIILHQWYQWGEQQKGQCCLPLISPQLIIHGETLRPMIQDGNGPLYIGPGRWGISLLTHFSLDLLVHEASSLFWGGYGFTEERWSWESICVVYLSAC